MIIVIILAIILFLLVVKLSKQKKELKNALKNLQESYNSIYVPQSKISEIETQIGLESKKLEAIKDELSKTEIQYAKSKGKIQKLKELYNSIEYSIANKVKLNDADRILYDELCPTVSINFHAMEVKDLQKEFKANDKLIQDVTAKFEARYSTKTIATIYKMMSIAMQSELQNILYVLKYEKLDSAVDSIKAMTAKYYSLASEGNQTISGTLSEYIAQLEYLYINAVKIEYNYYVKKEQAKAEQAALREQMRMEAAEKKALEDERKKIEKEELKYQSEIIKVNEVLSGTLDNEEKGKLEARILELQNQLSSLVDKKEDIIHLQNGKAGTVYVISNLGSFGDNVFKIGMTRRLNPQERIDELGDASVPFKFDVHSFIFSEDAVSLESKLHDILNQNRVNKVNLRKEFFKVSLDDLQKLVYDIDPSASFNMTMAAEEYRQSLSSDVVYSNDYSLDSTDDE